VQYLAANGNFGFRVNLSAAGSIPAHGWYLIAANGYAGSPGRDDSLVANNLSGTAGHALLVHKTTNVSGCADAAIVDKVGYGATATCAEGAPGHNAAQPTGGQTITRKPGGCAGSGTDTDVNDADFAAPAAPVFHGTASTPATPSPSALNDGPLCEGATLHLTASTVAGATYAWSGPNGFSSSQQNPTVANATAAASGTYLVTVNGCTSATTNALVIANGASCDDLALCTMGDTCGNAVCAGTPVACTALDQCHSVGTCDATTGLCGNPAAPDGSECSDGDACTTTDVCLAGSCTGTAAPVPGLVTGVLASKSGAATVYAWASAAAATAYDVLRGPLADGPVGSHPSSEACLADDVSGTTASDETEPASGEGYWYLVRAGNACGAGSYGAQGSGGVPTVPRTSPTCP
jgi:hypothetical protein